MSITRLSCCPKLLHEQEVNKLMSCSVNDIVIPGHADNNIYLLMIFTDLLQLSKHTRTVCTHQIRDCDYKDMGCQYKVCTMH